MDAAAADSDVKLYKASAEILEELRTKLPVLLYSSPGNLRSWVLVSKTAEVARLVS